MLSTVEWGEYKIGDLFKVNPTKYYRLLNDQLLCNSGNIPETIELYSKVISDHLELIAELETLLAAKRLEQKVMNVMPFLIVLYLEYTNRGYFDMMYHNLTGVVIMTGCLLVYMAAFALAERIFDKTYG